MLPSRSAKELESSGSVASVEDAQLACLDTMVFVSTKRYLDTTLPAHTNNMFSVLPTMLLPSLMNWTQQQLHRCKCLPSTTTLPTLFILSHLCIFSPLQDRITDIPHRLCAGVTVYSAFRKSTAQSGDFVVLLGAGGGLGHIATQMGSRGMGMRIIGIDHGSKKDLVLSSGAEHFIDHTTSKDVTADVQALTGGLGAQAVLVLTAANGAYASGMQLLKFGGTLVCVGLPEGELQPIATCFPQVMVAKEQKVVGSAVGNRKEAIETLDLAARGIIKTHYRTAKMDELTTIFQEMNDQKIQGRVVLDLQ